MGFDRSTLNVVMVATTAGLAIGGVIGIISPTFAEAGAAPHQRPTATVVTDVDVLGTDHMSITVRFSNTGRTPRHIDPAEVSVTAGNLVLRPRTGTAVDVRPGATVTSTFDFAAPAADAVLALHLPGGEVVPL